MALWILWHLLCVSALGVLSYIYIYISLPIPCNCPLDLNFVILSCPPCRRSLER